MELEKKIEEQLPWKPVPEDYTMEAGHFVRENDGTIWLVGDINELGGVCDCCCRTGNADMAEYCTIEEAMKRIGPNLWGIFKMKEVD